MSESTSKLIEDITPSNADKTSATTTTEAIEDNHDSVEPKPTASKRAYLDVKESVDKYKPFMLKQLETKKFKPSEALNKVRDFLPFFKESTNKLLDAFKENPNELNIENVQEDEEHIEMNLAVVSESESDEDDDDEDEEDDDDDEDDEDEGEYDEDEESSDNEDSVNSKNPLNAINLDIKVKDKTKLTKIKLSKSNSNKPMITLLDKNEEDASSTGEEDQQDTQN